MCSCFKGLFVGGTEGDQIVTEEADGLEAMTLAGSWNS